MNRLFYAFTDTEVIDWEIELDKFLQYETDAGVLVGKRTPRTILSVPLPGHELERQEKRLQESDIHIVNIIRDGHDVVFKHAKGPTVDANRWIGCILQSRRYQHLISHEIRYEDLVETPDTIQKHLQEGLGLTPRARFSQYPDFVDDKAFLQRDFANFIQYNPRPIDKESIGHKHQDYLSLFTSSEEKELFERLQTGLGYANGESCGQWDPEQLSLDQETFVRLSKQLGYNCE